MEQEKMETNDNLEQIRREKNKKRFWHYLLVYVLCLVVAFVVWLLVRYNMRTDEINHDAQNCAYETSASDVLAL